MFRIESDCFEAAPTRVNPASYLTEVNNIDINITPNPAGKQLKITASQNPLSIEIYNAQGQKMSGYWSSQPSQQLDIDHLDSGMYMLKVQFSNTSKSIRFIKE
jgi:hypothetical protein